MTERKDVEFEVEGGVRLRGWLYIPSTSHQPAPAISMAHGFAGVKEHGLERFASAFSEAGFVVLLHDHRGFGSSDGDIRHDVDPWRQIADWRRAISFLESRPEVDGSRIGLWGTSYAGGHVLVLAATDRRVCAVVAQVPTISGYEQGLRRIPPEMVASIDAKLIEDERAQARGEAPSRQDIVSSALTRPASYHSEDAVEFYLQPLPPGSWENTITVRSARAARMYEPGTWIARVSPTPLLVIVATHDTITLTDLALTAYERALEPKQLKLIPGGHFDPYTTQFALASSTALAWFKQHLR